MKLKTVSTQESKASSGQFLCQMGSSRRTFLKAPSLELEENRKLHLIPWVGTQGLCRKKSIGYILLALWSNPQDFVHFNCILILIKNGTAHSFGYIFYYFPGRPARLLLLQCKYQILPINTKMLKECKNHRCF